ncbi:uncharacterized protein LOC112050088 [Bicyclus anynana]|uniref:Uncharacterized protein LOC112050088 n=1 Tax=Bicyclus anynana TaxID=110368 RepID=A0A6J1NLI3_BICAN|nr:uncharacterized protein LOC112050088 [Bicyclus anynana]
MNDELDFVSKLPARNLIDPNAFDVSMSAVLIGLGAEKYIDIFREHNIGQCTLIELTDEDLEKLGVTDPEIRKKLIEEVKNLPIYEDTAANQTTVSPNLSVIDIIDVLEESSQHMYRIYLSMMTNTLVLKKQKTPDCLIYKDKYASHIAVTTLSHMTNVLNSMEIALHTQMKVYVSMHAYSQAWLLPSSHSHASFADDGVLMEMGKLATAALADMYGTKYQVGTAAEIRQPATGMSHDWAKARAGIKFSYHVDLRDSFGPYGFLLPGSQIVSTARETWQAVRAIVDNLSPGFK